MRATWTPAPNDEFNFRQSSRALRGSLEIVLDAAKAQARTVVKARGAHAALHPRVFAGRLGGRAGQAHELGDGEVVIFRTRHAGGLGLVGLLGTSALDALEAVLRRATALAVQAADARRGWLLAHIAPCAAWRLCGALHARAARDTCGLVGANLVSGAA